MSDDEALVRSVLVAMEDASPRLIYADFLEERGNAALAADLRRGPFVRRRFGGYGDGGDGAGGYGDGGDGAGGDGDGGYGDGGDGAGGDGDGGDGDGGDGDGGYGAGGDGDGGDGDGGYGDGGIQEVIHMKNGLYLVTLPGGWAPYILVAWIEVNGLELTLRSGRIIRRLGNRQSLSNLARKGPGSATQLLDPSVEEIVWRPNVGRAIPCNVEAWASHCPEPGSEPAAAKKRKAVPA